MDNMKEIVEKLNLWAYQYYTLDEPTVSDAEYDKLYDELLKLEKEEILKKAHERIEIEKDYYTGNILRFELIYMIPTKLFVFEVNKGSVPIKMPHIKVLSVNFDVVHEPYMKEIEKQERKSRPALAI